MKQGWRSVTMTKSIKIRRYIGKRNLPFYRSRYLIVFLVLFSVGGILLLTLTFASTYSVSLEAENGASSDLVLDDETASGGKSIRFGLKTQPGLRPIPDTLYGVTVESVGNISALKEALSKHTKMPTTRIVFQQGDSPSAYSTAVAELNPESYIMGEILDSTGLKSISINNYKNRTSQYVSAFSDKVDIWEIGNELNGEWVGNPNDIRAKVQVAYDVVEKDNATKQLRSAITLNYWPSSDCYGSLWEDTETFARSLPSEIKNGVDYVFLSFYETACEPRARPTNEQFIAIFSKLKNIFPNSKIGMGEIGAQGIDDGLSRDPSLSEKQQIANRYYGMHSALKSSLGSAYVGGYFWWYYYQDAVPWNKNASLWSTLENLFNSY